MKAAFALLAGYELHNAVRSLVWEMHRAHRVSIDHPRMAPHVSLKQPFEASDLPRLEAFMDVFAASLQPIDVHLTEIQLIPATIDGIDSAILWMDLVQTEALKALHARLNRELEARFGPAPADFDGPGYHFHLTLMIGSEPLDVYQRLFEQYGRRLSDLRATLHELAMFVYDERDLPDATYTTYKILPLSAAAR